MEGIKIVVNGNWDKKVNGNSDKSRFEKFDCPPEFKQEGKRISSTEANKLVSGEKSYCWHPGDYYDSRGVFLSKLRSDDKHGTHMREQKKKGKGVDRETQP